MGVSVWVKQGERREVCIDKQQTDRRTESLFACNMFITQSRVISCQHKYTWQSTIAAGHPQHLCKTPYVEMVAWYKSKLKTYNTVTYKCTKVYTFTLRRIVTPLHNRTTSQIHFVFLGKYIKNNWFPSHTIPSPFPWLLRLPGHALHVFSYTYPTVA